MPIRQLTAGSFYDIGMQYYLALVLMDAATWPHGGFIIPIQSFLFRQ